MHLRTIIRDYVFLAAIQSASWFMVALRLSELHTMHLCFHGFIVGLATLTICSHVVIVDCYKVAYKTFIYNFLGVTTLSLDVRRYYMLLL